MCDEDTTSSPIFCRLCLNVAKSIDLHSKPGKYCFEVKELKICVTGISYSVEVLFVFLCVYCLLSVTSCVESTMAAAGCMAVTDTQIISYIVAELCLACQILQDSVLTGCSYSSCRCGSMS